ncbi:uncharacterized protein LOC113211514 isoform X2 [Frankliniella occidentalis]|uniref:Uncharacterized protein LOC113211514 isoform X2 n=1 Tax=Frankliniella occidentalis TaxID=133901 RepID=A0A9C6X686_FRAOC|nr:uncharacterized protein LOC113211514 isoform X2 [Frankliniella occidentalis]
MFHLQISSVDKSKPPDTLLDPNKDVFTVDISEEEKELLEKRKFYIENRIWKEIMDAMRTIIDDHIVRLLHICGFRTYITLKALTDDDLKEIENFVKSGELQAKVKDPKEFKWYLGSDIDPKSFSFSIGEKRLIKLLIKYVTDNHESKDKPLGKNVSLLHPLFRRSVEPGAAGSPKRLKSSVASDKLVVTYDFPQEETNVRKLMKDHFRKEAFPEDYIKSVAQLAITIKTVERKDGAGLSASVKCPMCSEKIGGVRSPTTTWTLSNIYRHFVKHKDKKEHIPGTVSKSFFQPAPDRSKSPIHDLTHSDEEDGGVQKVVNAGTSRLPEGK